MKRHQAMRWILLFCGPMNVAGAIFFCPLVPQVRAAFALPEPHPFYLWVLSAWILAFGLSFFWQGWTGHLNRGILALAAWGKAIFAGTLLAYSLTGELPLIPAIAASPDLLLAGVFTLWLIWNLPATRPSDISSDPLP